MKRKPYSRKKKGKGLFDHLTKKETNDEAWRRIREGEVVPYFVENNLYDWCELLIQGVCEGNHNLAFAHSKKHIDWAKAEPQRGIDIRQVVRACGKCHHFIEYSVVDKSKGESGREVMYDYVVKAIEVRNKFLGKNL